MIIKNLTVGPLQANCFIIGDNTTGRGAVIDPGDEPDLIMEVIKDNRLKIDYIICTHGHFDHVGAVSDIKNETGAKIIIHKDETEIYKAARDMAAFWGHDVGSLPEPDILVKDEDNISIGTLSFTVLHTPGHSPGGICLYGEGIVLTGDTLFAGSVGRTDFYGGDMSKLKESFNKLMSLPEETRVLPGHGPHSTIGEEKRENPFASGFEF
jgi:glyoxylase-like metal-dependent hydrolase (beta-lactamase superfamily II)